MAEFGIDSSAPVDMLKRLKPLMISGRYFLLRPSKLFSQNP
jgi:hypothetical protein